VSDDARQSVARRRATLNSQLGLGEKLFTSANERRFADDIERGLVLVEEGLMNELRFGDALADVTARYLFEAGGKRIRPALALLTAQLGKGNTDEVITAAQAIEITHLASLYHDDVMDDAQLRRGVPTVQTVWGNSVAILTGDLLFARAARLVAGLGDKIAKIQSVTFERLCLGQLHETIGPQDGDEPVEHYLQVLSDKTGSLIATAAQIGVLLSDAPVEFQEPVLVYGEKIGVAFQLIDDVIDLMDGGTGKRAGTDIRAGVATLPMLYLQRQAPTDADAAELLELLHGGASPEPGDEIEDAAFDAAIARLREHDVTRRTVEEAHRWADEGIAALEALPKGPVRKALTKFAEGLLERTN
jgi:heptaprenyl diphosphate synthase